MSTESRNLSGNMKKNQSIEQETIYLDTNAFYFFFFLNDEHSEGIKRVIKSVGEGKIKAHTSCITLEELSYVILMRLIERKYKTHPREVIRDNPSAMIEFAGTLQEIFDTILSLDNLTISDAKKETISRIPFILEDRMLLPADCVHLQTMMDAGCKRILSTDTDFDKVPGIERMDGKRVPV